MYVVFEEGVKDLLADERVPKQQTPGLRTRRAGSLDALDMPTCKRSKVLSFSANRTGMLRDAPLTAAA